MRVLAGEDNERIARDVAAALTAAGYAVDHVVDGEEAWSAGIRKLLTPPCSISACPEWTVSLSRPQR